MWIFFIHQFSIVPHFFDSDFNQSIFTENLGAVRELSNVTGHLGLRVDDLEKANESVAVRLSKLRRGGSIKSSTSSFNSDPDDFKPKRKNPAKTLFQNRCVQIILLALVAAIAISLVSIATVYIIGKSIFYFKISPLDGTWPKVS